MSRQRRGGVWGRLSPSWLCGWVAETSVYGEARLPRRAPGHVDWQRLWLGFHRQKTESGLAHEDHSPLPWLGAAPLNIAPWVELGPILGTDWEAAARPGEEPQLPLSSPATLGHPLLPPDCPLLAMPEETQEGRRARP